MRRLGAMAIGVVVVVRARALTVATEDGWGHRCAVLTTLVAVTDAKAGHINSNKLHGAHFEEETLKFKARKFK